MHSMWTNRAISCCVIGRRGETNWTWAVYYFPTTLCGVLVFDSVSRVPPPPASSSSRLLPPFTTIFHILLCHTPSFTYNFVNHHLSHTTLSTTIFHTQLYHTPSFTHNFVAQAWHLVTSTVILRGRRGTWRHPPSFHVAGLALMALGWLWWRVWAGLVAGDAAALYVADVALGDIHLHLAWQVWHLVTSTFAL